MNPEQLLNAVAEAIAAKQMSTANRFCIYALNGKIHCVPVDPTPEGATRIGMFTKSELEKGFTNKQWSKILHRLAKVMEGGTG